MKKLLIKKLFSIAAVCVMVSGIFVLSVSASLTHDNLMANPSFDTNTSSWQHQVNNGAEGSIGRDESPVFDSNGCLKVNIIKSGNRYWYTRVLQPGRRVTAGVTYEVLFQAKAEPYALLEVALEQATTVRHQGIRIGSEPMTYTYEFEATGSSTDARLILDLGDSADGTTVWFDNFVLREKLDPLSFTSDIADGSINVTPRSRISLEFNHYLNDISAAIVNVTENGEPVSSSFADTGPNTAQILLGAAMKPECDYVITLSGAKDNFGQMLAETMFSFSTAMSVKATTAVWAGGINGITAGALRVTAGVENISDAAKNAVIVGALYEKSSGRDRKSVV